MIIDLMLSFLQLVVIVFIGATGIYAITRLISAAYYRSKYEVFHTLFNKKGHFHG